jgi:exonuclease III
LVFRYEYYDQVRLIFTDGRGHPPAEAPRRIDVFLLTVDLLDLLDSYRVVTDPRPAPDNDRLAASDHRPITIGLRRR